MDKQEAKELLSETLTRYRKLSYVDLVAKIDQDDHLEVTGSSGAQYQIEIQVFWDNKPSGDVRVMGAIDDGGLRAFVPLTDDFIVSPDGRFIGEE